MTAAVYSKKETIAGLPITAYSLDDLSGVSGKVAVLFFLHGRRGSAAEIEPDVEDALKRIARKRAEAKQAVNLVVVTFVCDLLPDDVLLLTSEFYCVIRTSEIMDIGKLTRTL